jgi:imidazolonepropionase-like amidohydrolase
MAPGGLRRRNIGKHLATTGGQSVPVRASNARIAGHRETEPAREASDCPLRILQRFQTQNLAPENEVKAQSSKLSTMPRGTRSRKRAMGLAVIAPLILSASRLPGQTSRPSDAVVAIRNVSVVPMDTERVDVERTVILRGAAIERVGPAQQTAVPSGATVIEGRGKYLVPGLADMHVHLADPGDPPGTAEAELMLFLANGVTTIRSMRGFPNHLVLRDSVARGELLGPTIITAGPGLDGQSAKSPAEGEAAVQEQKMLGYDLIKVLPGLSLPTYDAIARTAHQLKIPFAGHIPPDVGLLHALDAGQQTVEHLDGYLELLKGSKPIAREKVLQVVRRTLDSGTWNCPTMAVMEANLGLIEEAGLLSRPELEYVPEAFVKQWLKIRSYGNPPRAVSAAMEGNRMTLLKALNDAHSRILLGTDSPQLFNVPGFSIRREIRLMSDAGLKPYDILRSATERVGEFTGRPCGTIKPGQCADLVLLDADPLKDIENLNRLAGVVVQGRWLSSSDLQRRLQAIRGRPGNYRRQASSR